MVHAALLVAIGLLVRHASEQGSSDVTARPHHQSLVYLAMPGPAGGGGGGGNRSPAPQRLEAPGRDRANVPAARTQAPRAQAPEPEPLPQLTLAAVPVATGTSTLPGIIEPISSTTPNALGQGDGGGADRGQGQGIGPGSGSGLGPGGGGGEGGEVYHVGNGVTAPRLLRRVSPQYTADAMRARITGRVALDCIVGADGRVERCQVQRSLDPRYGLDARALEAASQWSFAPGTRLGQPVRVRVTIEMTFSIQ